MATHGDDTIDGDTPRPNRHDDRSRPNGSFPGTDSDAWHRTLTGRQAPEPVGAKLRKIYGNVLAEALPDRFIDLLADLDQKGTPQ